VGRLYRQAKIMIVVPQACRRRPFLYKRCMMKRPLRRQPTEQQPILVPCRVLNCPCSPFGPQYPVIDATIDFFSASHVNVAE